MRLVGRLSLLKLQGGRGGCGGEGLRCKVEWWGWCGKGMVVACGRRRGGMVVGCGRRVWEEVGEGTMWGGGM